MTSPLTPLRSRLRWILIFWMFLVSAIAYMDRVNISISGQAIAREFHLTDYQLGAVFSAFVFGYALFQAPGGWVADRLGPRKTLAFGVIWWAVFCALITLLGAGFPLLVLSMIAIQFSLGVGESVVYPSSNCVVANWIPTNERGLANGIIFAGVGFGAGVTPPLMTYVLTHFGWRAAFWLSAGLGLIAGGVWYLLARDRPRQHPAITQPELAHIEAGLPQKIASGAAPRLPLRAIFANRDMQLVTFSYFTYGYAAYIFFTWFFIYLNRVRHLDLRESSYLTSLPFLCMAFGSSAGGWLSDRIVRRWGRRAGRCWLAVFGIGFAAIFLAIGARVSSAHLASFVLAGGAGALYISQSSFWSVSADIGGTSAGLVSGLMNMGAQLGSTVTGVLTPILAHRFGWTWSFLAAAILCALGSLAWIRVDPDSRIRS